MSDPNEVKIVNPELLINKKLGNAKFEQAFDSTTINRTEKTVEQSQEVFKTETTADYNNLKTLFAELRENLISQTHYQKLSELAFSIKSRAATGGAPLASEVANSMYKFCDAAAAALPPNGYKVIKLHMDALMQVFEHNFGVGDAATSHKLIFGLEEVSHRFLDHN